MKTVFMFPGQGAQFPGMGKDLFESSNRAREMMLRANDILGFNITDIMFEGSDEDLRATRVSLQSSSIQYARPSAAKACRPRIWSEATPWESSPPW